MYRQGDVLIVSLSCIPRDQIQYRSIPETAALIPRPAQGYALADGKATGHTHRITSPFAELYQLGDVRFLRKKEPVTLTHEEHGSIVIPVGEYRVTGHHEAQPGELPRQVED